MRRRVSKASKYPVKSLIKALRILDALGESSTGCSITELSRELKIGKSTVHRLLATLKDVGYVMVDPLTSRYTLGSTIARLAEQLSHQSPLLNLGTPTMQLLSRDCNETTNLATLEGRDVLYIAKQDSPEPLRMSGQVGRRLPAYSTALGKALLAALSDREVRRLYGGANKLRKLTPNTIDSLDDLTAELETIRREGFAFDREETYIGVQCLAAAVRDHSGKVVAAISISAPKHRMTPESKRLWKDALLRRTRELSEKLGYVPPESKAAG